MRKQWVKKVRALVGVAVVAGLTLTGCSQAETPKEPSAQSSSVSDLLVAEGLDGLDGRELITRLDALPVADQSTDLFASIRSDVIVLTDTQTEESLDLKIADDEFYVSFAPYIEQTHDCYFHSLTTCQGELSGEELHVTITDRADGAVLVDEITRTYDNGFIGYWLPRGIEARATFEYDGRSVSADFATGPDDATCITTLQLRA